MLCKPLSHQLPLPLVVELGTEVETTVQGAIEWAKDHAVELEELVSRNGALLVRGFPIESPAAFRAFCSAIRPDLKDYAGGDSPRRSLDDQVYSSSEYPEELEVLLHNELSYAAWWPQRLFFSCLKPASSGGETHIADGRAVYRNIPDRIREKFETLGVQYHQHLWDAEGETGIGKSWQDTFQTNDRLEVEEALAAAGAYYEWTDFGLRSSLLRPAVVRHPVTSDVCWFNQVDQWHRDFESVKLSIGARNDPRFDPATAGEESLGSHATYGDGSEIEPRDLAAIRAVCRDCELLFPWQAGDVMILDNLLVMHGRKPFSGPRQVVVAMA